MVAKYVCDRFRERETCVKYILSNGINSTNVYTSVVKEIFYCISTSIVLSFIAL